MAERLSASAGWDLVKAILSLQPAKGAPASGTATFMRRDPDGTCWVLLPGAEAETPVNGDVVAAANPGDEVRYETRDGTLTLTGNTTDPAAGVSRASQIAATVVRPVRIAVDTAHGLAKAAEKVANAINQHFWSDDSGIHVTQATQEEWLAENSGPNVLINSAGQLFRDGLSNLLSMTTESGARALAIWDGAGNAAANVIASFGEIIRLGRATAGHTLVTPSGMSVYGADGSHLGTFGAAETVESSVISESPEVGVAYALPSSAMALLTVTLSYTALTYGTDYETSEGAMTLLASSTVEALLSRGSSTSEDDEGSDATTASLSCTYVTSSEPGLSLGAELTTGGLLINVPSRFTWGNTLRLEHGRASANAGITVGRTDTGVSANFGVGIGGINHGVWSAPLNRWLIWGDRSLVHLSPFTVADGMIRMITKKVTSRAPSSNAYGEGLWLYDSSEVAVGGMRQVHLASGRRGLNIVATRKISGVAANNQLYQTVDSSGRPITMTNASVHLTRTTDASGTTDNNPALVIGSESGEHVEYDGNEIQAKDTPTSTGTLALNADGGDVTVNGVRVPLLTHGWVGQENSVPAGGYKDVSVSFGRTYGSAPHVLVGLNSTSTAAPLGEVSVGVYSVSKTGFVARMFNNGTSARTPGFYWLAVG